MPVQRRVTVDGRVSFHVPALPGRPARTYRVDRGAAEDEAARAAEEYFRAGERDLALLDAEIRDLSLHDLRHLVLARRALPKGKNLAEFVGDIYGTAARPIGLRVAARTYLTELSSRGRSEIHISNSRRVLDDLLVHAGDETLLLLRRPTVQDYLDSCRTDKVYNKKRALLSAFFSWARGRAYVLSNPVDDIPARFVRADSDAITFLSLPHIRDLFRITLRTEPGLLWYYALQVFAGLRPTEAVRFPVPNPGAEYLRVGADRAKTRTCRSVPVLPPLALAFTLLPCPEPVVPYHTGKERRLRTKLREEGVPMTPDVLRHTFATYRFPIQGEGELSRDMGNSPDVIFRHYRGVVTLPEAEEFLTLNPLQDFTAEAEEAYRIRGVLRKLRARKKRTRKLEEPLLVRPFFPRKRDASLPLAGRDFDDAQPAGGNGGEEESVEVAAMPGESAATCGAIPPPVVADILKDQNPMEVQ